MVRAEREVTSLTRLRGHYPVPEVIQFDPSPPVLLLSEVVGRHGQELIDQGLGATVLRLTGTQLAKLQTLDPSIVPGLKGRGDVIVHGDFGPQNTLYSFDVTQVAGVLDWEMAHLGSPIEESRMDKWIIRMHHPEVQDDLPELFAASGLFFGWSERQASMARQCRRHLEYCEASQMQAAVAEWKRRLDATEKWYE